MKEEKDEFERKADYILKMRRDRNVSNEQFVKWVTAQLRGCYSSGRKNLQSELRNLFGVLSEDEIEVLYEEKK